jgi:hypothetical protein
MDPATQGGWRYPDWGHHGVAWGDIDAVADLAAIAGEAERAMRQAVAGLRKAGYSWADIGTRLGVTKQAAQQRWGSQSGTKPQVVAPPRLREPLKGGMRHQP